MATVAFVAGTGVAHAANLTLDAPESCVDPTTLAQEVADLVGRPLGDVPDVDFRLSIRPAENGRWRSTLEAIEHRPGVPEARHLRELEARSCADLGEAAALAMSVSIRAATEAAASAPNPPPAPPPPPAPDAAVTRAASPQPVQPAWYGLATVALAGDAGDLPGAGLGIALSVGAGRGMARLNALGGWLPPRDSVHSDGTGGGSLQLVYGGAEGCFAPSWARWTALGCAGGELGVQHGHGLDVTSPTTVTVLWRAVRASLGLVFRSSGALGLRVTATVVAPLARPQFVVDGTSDIFRASPVAGRVDAGLELRF
jgi:hypothetical protein